MGVSQCAYSLDGLWTRRSASTHPTKCYTKIFPKQSLYAEMSERSIVQSWNGCVRKRTPGSNPGLCAKKNSMKTLFFLCFRVGFCKFHLHRKLLFARTRGYPSVLGYSSVSYCHPSISAHFVLSI